MADTSTPAGSAPGTQTLARGLRALELVAGTPDGLTIGEVADHLGVHRSIATRLLATLADFHLVARSADGRYRGAGGLAALAREVYTDLAAVALPVMQDLANAVGSSVALFVAESSDAVAVKVVEPLQAWVRVSYREGARHPLDRGAAGYALLAALPPVEGEDPRITAGRTAGHVESFGEVLPGYWGLGVPIPHAGSAPAACLTLISASEELITSAINSARAAAARIADSLA